MEGDMNGILKWICIRKWNDELIWIIGLWKSNDMW